MYEVYQVRVSECIAAQLGDGRVLRSPPLLSDDNI